MPITVAFEKPPGTVTYTRQFQPGDQIRVSGKVTGLVGLGEPLLRVRLEITDRFSPMFGESRTNLLGNYWFDVTLPQVVSQAKVVVTAWFYTGAEQVSVPIGIGTEPEPIPAPTPGLLESLLPLLLVMVVLGLVSALPGLFKEMGAQALRRSPESFGQGALRVRRQK